ncbi:MAG: NAD(P)-binding protein [Planctomycetota bacterium]
MTHTSHQSTGSALRWERWVIVLLVASTLVFGFWGHWKYELKHSDQHTPDVMTVLYHSVQLLIAHGVHLDGSVPGQLQAGRLLGIATAFMAGMLAFAKFFRNEWLMCQLSMWRCRKHIVICGLGDLGLRLALDLRREEGRFVVAVEREGSAADIEMARSNGVLVLEGDARDLSVLQKARVERAEYLVAACPDDETNVAIAVAAEHFAPAAINSGPPLVCRLMLRDPLLRRLLEAQGAFGHGGHKDGGASARNYRVNFGDLNLEDVAARQALRRFPLDFEPVRKGDETIAHVIIAGFGPMGQAFALHAVRVAQFANAVTNKRRIRVTIVDRDSNSKADEFWNHFAKIHDFCDVTLCNDYTNEAEMVRILVERSRESKQHHGLVTYAACFEKDQKADDLRNLRIGFELSKETKDRTAQTLIYQSTRRGFAALFPTESENSRVDGRVHAFGMIEDIYSRDVLLHESEDKVARAIHGDYVAQRLKEGETAAGWEELSDAMKDSNRHAADHIPTKLRALGYHDAPLQDGHARIEEFDDKAVELLAPLEHTRWCVERWLDGWKHGPETDRPMKISKDLVDWDKLPPKEQKKDYEQIRAIPRVLKNVGRGIYR